MRRSDRRDYYRSRYDLDRPAARARQQAIYKARRAWVDALKDVPCMDCHGRFPPECMDFDHRPGTVKAFQIALNLNKAMARLTAEIEKCDIVCANCHRIRTKARKNGG